MQNSLPLNQNTDDTDQTDLHRYLLIIATFRSISPSHPLTLAHLNADTADPPER